MSDTKPHIEYIHGLFRKILDYTTKLGFEEEQFDDDERLAIMRFLSSRKCWNERKLKSIAEMASDPPDSWDLNSIKYVRWTDGVINWLFASLLKNGGRKSANSKDRGQD